VDGWSIQEMTLANSVRSFTAHPHYPELQPNEMAFGTEPAQSIMEMRVLLIGQKVSKADRSATTAHN
jgi:hypothetical protein